MEDSTSLKEIIKERLKKDVIQDAAKNKKNADQKYSLIVADDVTIKILHHSFKMHELNDVNVGLIVNVKFVRERMKVAPIYFLSPSDESVRKMIDDYRDPKKPQYSVPIHIYFCGSVSPRLIQMIKDAQDFKKSVMTIKEVHCNFLTLEKRVFHLNRPEAFHNLYFNQDRTDELNITAQQLVGLCLTMGEEPNIRYSGASRLALQLAQCLEKGFNDIKRNLPNGTALNQERTTLLILDRSDDPLTPLFHELSFQAMIMDLLNDNIKPEDNTIVLGSNEEKSLEVLPMPEETDPVWIEYRHAFIGKVVEQLPKKFQQWQDENAVAKLKKKGADVETKDFLAAARDLPQYQQEIKNYKKHISLASACTESYKSLRLSEIVNLEEEITTGTNEDGKKSDRTQIQQKFSDLLLDNKKPQLLKLRLFMMYIIAQGGIAPKQRDLILTQGGFDQSAQDTIINLGNLGVILQPDHLSDGHRNKEYYKYMQKIAKERADAGETTQRYTPFLEWVVLNHIDGNLNEKEFPWIRAPNKQSKTAQTRSYRTNRTSTVKPVADHSRLIVFMLGGMSYSEMRICYQLSKLKETDIYIGSTSPLTPQSYIRFLGSKIAK